MLHPNQSGGENPVEGISVTTDGGPVAELTVGDVLGYNNVVAQPYDDAFPFNSFSLQIVDEEDPNLYSENSLTVYSDGAPEFDTVLGTTSNGVEVKYMDGGNGIQYEYQWTKNGLTMVLNESFKQGLMTIKEIETIVNNIVVVAR